MATKTRTAFPMNLYQQIHHAARDNKSAAEILRLCRLPLDNVIKSDSESGPDCANSADVIIALWAVAARLNVAERHIETLKRKLRRDSKRTGKKPEAEFLKKTPESAPEHATKE